MNTTTHMEVIFSSCFIICDVCMTKIGSLPIPCHKRSSATKIYFFVINLVTIILSSLICDAHFCHNQYQKTSQNHMLELLYMCHVRQKTS